MKTKIILSFDDGRLDNYYIAKEILIPKNIPATFNITTDYIMGRDIDFFPCSNYAMSKENIIELSKNNLFEIAGHGQKHNNEMRNLLLGRDELCKWCNFFPKGIASPNSKLSFDEVLRRKKEYEKNKIEYVRLGSRIYKLKFIKRICIKLNKVFRSGSITKFIYKDSYITEKDTFVFPSIPILHDITVEQIHMLIEKAIREKKSIIFMFHSICRPKDKFYNDLWSWDFNKFTNLCDYLLELEKDNKIKLCRTEELIKGRKEKC